MSEELREIASDADGCREEMYRPEFVNPLREAVGLLRQHPSTIEVSLRREIGDGVEMVVEVNRYGRRRLIFKGGRADGTQLDVPDEVLRGERGGRSVRP